MTRKIRLCSICKEPGHYSPKCPHNVVEKVHNETKCCAITNKGTKCNQQKLYGYDYCGIHLQLNRCQAYDKNKKRCSQKIVSNTKFCCEHLKSQPFGIITNQIEKKKNENEKTTNIKKEKVFVNEDLLYEEELWEIDSEAFNALSKLVRVI